ncbi:aminotransferase class I/II-fold pyridoxal phosphate-dependent enzyme [Methanoculleus sp. FWC-SCC1]|uniref:Aminotransferase class I/II-fold pyridoxal phosphate-dependent enzyme n=1 Tax=Methanoculleus frigidifontis TaxID=2584085 RepID=A0ABT8M8L3_9EURY|nr:aminotransferase class I/II-fold pyridoxal phosphate-dependent enzyme [Methanoculleus sp. FWC-SCC1]MDN7024277.1 aminotransferase class I/II-fold pyridoxal phosphate-dependent enzyme [Methanoculleus sp. FWC-SCC1]
MNLREFKLERFLAEYEFRAPYLLCTSDCESVSIGDLLAMEEGAADAFSAIRLGYGEPAGSPALREAIAGLYEGIGPDAIVAFNGASEGILAYMSAVLAPGDHIVVQCPAYQSLHETARANGCSVTPWRMTEQSGSWHLDLDTLEESIRKTTRAIVINSPHNPTGYQIPRRDFLAIAEIADDHGIAVFSDEVYRCLEHPGTGRLPAMADIAENGISLGVMSKAFGLAGLRTGWIATHDTAVLRRVGAFKDYSTICNSVPSEFLAALALRHADALVERNLGIVGENIRLLEGFFDRHRDLFAWSHPAAGSTAFPAIRFDEDVEQFCIRLVEEWGVLLLPGTVFDYDGRHFRMGYGRRDLARSLERLEEAIEAGFCP